MSTVCAREPAAGLFRQFGGGQLIRPTTPRLRRDDRIFSAWVEAARRCVNGMNMLTAERMPAGGQSRWSATVKKEEPAGKVDARKPTQNRGGEWGSEKSYIYQDLINYFIL
jgi:hypothetical protein